MTRIVDKFPYRVERRDYVVIPLKDGTQIAATIWLPDNAEQQPVPAIVEMVPYRRRDGTVFRDWPMHHYLAGHGFACCRIDLRGSGDSGGLLRDEYTPQEQEDACTIIAWLAAQRWCTGVVGMTGISWGGFNALQVAALRPPALKAIITLCSSDDRYADDVHYMGGCLLTEDAMWASFMLAQNALPPDPQIVGERWREMWAERLEANTCWSEHWLEHQRRDDYWKQGSVAENYDAIEVPVYAIGGWEDSYSNTIPRLLGGLKGPRKGLIGPWSHQYPCRGTPGPLIGYLQEVLRWWRYWLKGEDTGIMDEPMLRVWINDPENPQPFFVRHAGRWVTEASWPSPRIHTRTLYLNAHRLAEHPEPGEALLLRSPLTAGRDCGRWGGYGGESPDLPSDQRREDGVSLCFDTAPLQEDLDLLGAVTLDLTVSADMPGINLVARLCDVAPDGRSTLISWGVLNLSHRDSHEFPTSLVRAEPVSARLQLNDIGRHIVKGSRLRLALGTQHWPIIWPQPFLGTLRLEPGTCRLHLPIRPPAESDATIPPFEPAETAPLTQYFEQRQGRSDRRITEDVATQSQTIEMTSDYGRFRLEAYDIVADSISKESLTITGEDPLSARLDSRWFMGFISGEADVEIRSRVTLTSDETAFELIWRIQAFERGRLVHDRSNRKRIPRDFL
jgi:putative CocE/NonD family hydrolase